jgi:hypothetical protein
MIHDPCDGRKQRMEPGGTILMELIFVISKHRGQKISIARFPPTRNLRVWTLLG